MSSSACETTSPERFTGRVKWFNNKAGYGFVTVTDGPKAGSDIFIHHSSIKVDAEQYKYLVQGEYIDFDLSAISSGEHDVQAGNVSGIKGGKLMCETRSDTRVTRTQYKTSSCSNDEPTQPPVRAPQSVRAQSVRAPQSVRAQTVRPQSVRQQTVRPQSVRQQFVRQQPSVRQQETREDGEWKFVYNNASRSKYHRQSGGDYAEEDWTLNKFG